MMVCINCFFKVIGKKDHKKTNYKLNFSISTIETYVLGIITFISSTKTISILLAPLS